MARVSNKAPRLANVALQVARDVVGEPVAGCERAVVQGRVGAAPHQGIQVPRQQVRRGKLGHGEGQELDPSDTPCQRLADTRHEPKLLGAREDEIAHASAAVHQPLEVGDQVRNPLYLVDDRALGEAGEKATLVDLRLLALVGVFQRDIGAIGEDRPGEGYLALLARPGDGEDRESPYQAQSRFFSLSGDHGEDLTN